MRRPVVYELRSCLKCLKKFPSTGPGNRVCRKCARENDAEREPRVYRSTPE